MVFIAIGLSVVAAVLLMAVVRSKPSLDELGSVSSHWLEQHVDML